MDKWTVAWMDKHNPVRKITAAAEEKDNSSQMSLTEILT